MRFFKVCPKADWLAAKRDGVYAGTKMDRGFGYIHLCTDKQLPAVLSRHASDRNEMVVLEIDADKIKQSLRHERDRAGVLYPHLYDMLAVSAVVQVRDVTPASGGHFKS